VKTISAKNSKCYRAYPKSPAALKVIRTHAQFY